MLMGLPVSMPSALYQRLWRTERVRLGSHRHTLPAVCVYEQQRVREIMCAFETRGVEAVLGSERGVKRSTINVVKADYK